MRFLTLFLILLGNTVLFAQNFDFSASTGICFTNKLVTNPTVQEKTGNGTSVVLKALKTGHILYFGGSVSLHYLSTSYTAIHTEPNTILTGKSYDVNVLYASPGIEANLHLGKRFSFADNTIDAGITAGIGFNNANGTSEQNKIYAGSYKPLLLGMEIGYTHYFKMIGFGIAVNPHISNSVHDKNLSLIVIPATIGVHVRL
jgi:hypothetical protein